MRKPGLMKSRGKATYGQLQLDQAAALWDQSLDLAVLVYRAKLRVMKYAEEERRAERDRCLKICGQYPDNLMAKRIAELIRKGEA